MGWFQDARLTTKLTFTFLFCALATLLTAAVGGQGITHVSKYLERALASNRVSAAAENIRTSITEQNRDLYKLLIATVTGAADVEKSRIVESIKSKRVFGETALGLYITTPLAEGNLTVGELNAKDWPAYQAGVERFVSHLDARDTDNAKRLLEGELQPYYERVVEELKIIHQSNSDQLAEHVGDASVQVHDSQRMLVIISVGALICALVVGILLAHLISQPIATAVQAVQRIGSGDFTQPIDSTRQDEAGILLRALDIMQNRLKDDIQNIALTSDQIITIANKVSCEIRQLEQKSKRLTHH